MKIRSKQQGFALIVLLALLTTAAAAITVKAINNGNNQITRDQITAAALAQAKDALIGRAVTDNNRPGSLPCPDTNNDGIAELFAGNDCPSYIGRLPWRTLGLPDISDGSRERLWYALSNNFRDHTTAQPINSDTTGNRQVFAADGTLLTNQAVAIIFSAGDVLTGQNRSAANINDATQYLESVNCPGSNCRNNAVAAGPFIADPLLDANGNRLLNDKLLVIQTKDFIPTVEKRVAKELNGWLQDYYTAHHYYPYPAQFDHTHCDHGDCQGDTSVCRGRFPRSPAAGDAVFTGLPAYFINNDWYREIYYSVGSLSLQTPASVTCAPMLTVGTAHVRAVFFTPGTPIAPITRPSDLLSYYLEDAENQDGWSGLGIANDLYVIPTAQTFDRDRLISLP